LTASENEDVKEHRGVVHLEIVREEAKEERERKHEQKRRTREPSFRLFEKCSIPALMSPRRSHFPHESFHVLTQQILGL
jgi:hypothetical protein